MQQKRAHFYVLKILLKVILEKVQTTKFSSRKKCAQQFVLIASNRKISARYQIIYLGYLKNGNRLTLSR